jgi:hypothetical protein
LVAFDREEDSLAGSKARVAELDSEGRRVHGTARVNDYETVGKEVY